MSWLQVIVLSIVQGVTEFLPVSSSGHLRIVSELFWGVDAGASFTAVVQLGTELAVLVFFARDIWQILTGWFRGLFDKERRGFHYRMGWMVIVGTIPVAVLGFFGLALTFASSQSGHHPLRLVAELYVDVLRGIPMLVVILYVGFPLQGAIRDATGGFIDMSRLTRGVVGISLGYAAYMAEIFRAGIEAIGKGQTEAARSLGLSNWQTARHVILPQALRIVVPPLGNEFIAMLKDTSLLSALSVRDITQRARELQASNFEVFPPFNTVAILYIVLTLMASSLAKTVERRSSWNR